ncbi:hypothetical protein HBB16_15970 [Pseudonocardia sp. MCCB 268]|nr:hypothetical protein [Pseudonocardia cytotoxica]
MGEHDISGLDAVNRRARAINGCIATLPVHRSWLDRRRGLPCLVDRVARPALPVARRPQRASRRPVRDPVRPRRDAVVARGRRSRRPAAIRPVRSRHALYGARHRLGTKDRPAPRLSFREAAAAAALRRSLTVVRDLRSFVSLGASHRGAGPTGRTRCGVLRVPSCNGRQLDQLARLPDERQRTRAFGHAVHMMLDLRTRSCPEARRPHLRQQSWWAHCSSALNHYEGLRDGHASWTAPAAH